MESKLFHIVELGSCLELYCLRFPFDQNGELYETDVLERTTVEIVDIPNDKRGWVTAHDAQGREYKSPLVSKSHGKIKVSSSFVAEHSIQSEGGSPEWWTAELIDYNRVGLRFADVQQ